jgi:hypothetical protein
MLTFSIALLSATGPAEMRRSWLDTCVPPGSRLNVEPALSCRPATWSAPTPPPGLGSKMPLMELEVTRHVGAERHEQTTKRTEQRDTAPEQQGADPT